MLGGEVFVSICDTNVGVAVVVIDPIGIARVAWHVRFIDPPHNAA